MSTNNFVQENFDCITLISLCNLPFFNNFIFKEEDNKEVKKNNAKCKWKLFKVRVTFLRRYNLSFSSCNLYSLCHKKQDIFSLPLVAFLAPKHKPKHFLKAAIFFIFSLFTFLFLKILLLKMYVYFVMKSDECSILSFQRTLSIIFVGFLWSNFNPVHCLRLANKCV